FKEQLVNPALKVFSVSNKRGKQFDPLRPLHLLPSLKECVWDPYERGKRGLQLVFGQSQKASARAQPFFGNVGSTLGGRDVRARNMIGDDLSEELHHGDGALSYRMGLAAGAAQHSV